MTFLTEFDKKQELERLEHKKNNSETDLLFYELLTPIINELGNIYYLAKKLNDYRLNYYMYDLLKLAFIDTQSNLALLKKIFTNAINIEKIDLIIKSLENIRNIINNKDNQNDNKKSYILFSYGQQVMDKQEWRRDRDKHKQNMKYKEYNLTVTRIYNNNNDPSHQKEEVPNAPREVANYAMLFKKVK